MLKAVLSTAPTVILIMCIVAAFATHGWRAALFPEDLTKTVKRLMPFKLDAEAKFLEVASFELSEDGTFVLELKLNSLLSVPVQVEELSVEVAVGESTSVVSLPNAVEVPAKGSANLRLEGKLPAEALENAKSSEQLTLRSASMRINVSGIILEVWESTTTR
ncbi:MAG: hypothetical protein OD815_000372 [Candidatus Alkanophagales archaeon MCA70_species_2]|nr:hypothetical protein [Candidatus Alkanophaga liquidiphilum]